LLLAVYSEDRSEVIALKKKFDGQVRAIAEKEWLPTKPTPPTHIGNKLVIVHEADRKTSRGRHRSPRDGGDRVSLHIPHGIAFGSGEHATTFMLLRALAEKGDWNATSVLDLGTGSGVLALAARQFGARKIVATDFDPDSVRTSRQNEALNFSTRLIRWRQADVRKLHATSRYGLVLANLFSGILCEAAAPIAGCVSTGGRLWLSGILDSQQKEVAAAYRAQGLQLAQTMRRGKWVMLQFTQPG
jgi:ribosomal protein L11 methyltransferase